MKILDTRNNISKKRLQEIEKKYNIVFPREYREHLLTYNGGTPVDNIVEFIEDGEPNETDFRYFFAVDTDEYDDLEKRIFYIKVEEKRMPEHIFPFGEDSLGNQFCISFGSKDHGFVYFWDHEREVDYSVSDDSDYSNLYLIAKSFKEFVENLKPDDNIEF